MKIAVIGAGSTYTPELVSGLTRERERIDVRELALHDIDRRRGEVVGGLAERILRREGFPGTLTITGELDRALDGADAVLVQIRVGGQAARLRDETIPAACSCVGQETTGAGGLGKAMRTVPAVLAIAQRARELASSDAWIIDFTNPVGIVTRSLLDAGHRAIGLCNVAITFQRHIAAHLGVPPDRLVVDQVGLNHLTWIRALWLDGRDVLPEVLRSIGDALAMEVELPRELLEELGAIPSYYLRYFYAEREVVQEQRVTPPRAQIVADIERRLLELYRDPRLAEVPALLEQRGGAFYSEAAIKLVASLTADTGDTQVVDVRNDATLPGLSQDDVVEVPARIGAGGAVPVKQPPLAPELLGLVQHVASYERLAAAAAASGDRRTARLALMANPLVREYGLAASMLDRMLAAEVSAGDGHRREWVSATPTSAARSTALVLAVDGGNFKTDLALVDSSGALLSVVRGGGSSAHHLGIEGSVGLLESLMEGPTARAGFGAVERPLAAAAYVLLAGADLPEERSALRARIERLNWSERLVVDNDTLALLRAGTDRGWGIAVACGAGINCLGQAPDGREVRFLSLGEISGDWGGGGDVGVAALAAAARSADGRGPRTVLENAVPAHFGLTDPLEVSRAVHLRRVPVARLGELAPIVLSACKEDSVAADIVGRLGDEVIALARAALERLELTESDAEIILGGRLLRALSPTTVETITSGVHDAAPNTRVVVAGSEPIVGAALLGLDAIGADASAIARARAELDAAVVGLVTAEHPPTTPEPWSLRRPVTH